MPEHGVAIEVGTRQQRWVLVPPAKADEAVLSDAAAEAVAAEWCEAHEITTFACASHIAEPARDEPTPGSGAVVTTCARGVGGERGGEFEQ